MLRGFFFCVWGGWVFFTFNLESRIIPKREKNIRVNKLCGDIEDTDRGNVLLCRIFSKFLSSKHSVYGTIKG